MAAGRWEIQMLSLSIALISSTDSSIYTIAKRLLKIYLYPKKPLLLVSFCCAFSKSGPKFYMGSPRVGHLYPAEWSWANITCLR